LRQQSFLLRVKCIKCVRQPGFAQSRWIAYNDGLKGGMTPGKEGKREGNKERRRK